MPLYESVFIVRQDVSSHDVDKIMDGFIDVIKKNSGKVVKHEYWGMRNLAYEINNNRKGHYVMLALDAPVPAIREMERKMKNFRSRQGERTVHESVRNRFPKLSKVHMFNYSQHRCTAKQV